MSLSRRRFVQTSLGAGAALGWSRASLAQASKPQAITCLFPFQTFGTDWSFFFAAQALGYFKEEGLDVTAQPTKGSPEVGRLLAAGQGDIGFAGAEAIIMNVSKGLPVRDVFTVQQGVVYRVGVPEGSPIKTVADLKGKRIGSQSLTGSTVFLAKALVKQAGLDPERDVTFIPIGLGAQAMAALRAKEVDAATFGDTTFVEFAQNGMPFSFFPLESFSDHFGVGIVTPAAAVTERGDTITRFSRAVAKGIVYSFANPEATVRQMQKVVPGVAAKDFEGGVARLKVRQEAIKLPAAAGGQWGWNTPERYNAFADFLLGVGFIERPVKSEEVMDRRYIKAINAFDPEPVIRAAKSA